MTRIAIYPGTFDPVTLGHLDVLDRALHIFPRLILAVARRPPRDTLFTAEERVALLREVLKDRPNVEVDSFDGMLVNYARTRGATVLIRGLRALSDFEHEFQMALTNRKLAPEVETLFMTPKEAMSHISSSMVRQVAMAGGDTTLFAPAPVRRALRRKFGA